MPTKRPPGPIPQPGAHPGADLDDLRGTRPAPGGSPVPAGSRTRRSGRALFAIAMTVGLAPTTAAAATSGHHDDHAGARPVVTIDAGPAGLTGPAELPAGLVDIIIDTQVDGSDEIGHSVYFARIADGATLADVAAAGPEALAGLLTFVGGAGGVHDGANIDLTLDLRPGNYIAIDNVFLPQPTGVLPFVVADDPASAAEPAAEPAAEGTVQVGPGMLIAPPEGFDGSGTWRFWNADDTVTHEALIVRLGAGVGVPELVAWADDGRPEPAPFEAELAGAGPLGPGEQAWLTLPELEPGDYALICYVPFEDGQPHLSEGMIAPFTVT